MPPKKPEKESSGMEKHVQTILVTCLTAGILYIVLAVTTMNTGLAVLQSTMGRLEGKVNSLDGIQFRVQELEKRLEKLEK